MMINASTRVIPLVQRDQFGPEKPDLDAVYDRYAVSVYRYMYSRLGNREDAEDLTAEVFLKAARTLDGSRSEASMAKWLFTVAHTVLADHWRHYYRSGAPLPLDETRAAAIEDIESVAQPGRAEAIVEQLLDRLPPRYRLVLELRFLRGYTLQETAREMGVTVENAKVIQHRALAKAVKIGEEQP